MSTLAQMVLYDAIGNRPSAGITGRTFFATDTGVTYRDNGSGWDVDGTFYGSGATGARPVVTIVGATYFDTDLGEPIWWKGAVWVDATGTGV